MGWATTEQLQTAYNSMPTYRAYGEASRRAFLETPSHTTTLLQQMGAAFRQESLFAAGYRALQDDMSGYVDPTYDAAMDLGEYAEYTDRFPELLRANNSAHMQHIKHKIQREINDRRILEDLGFWRSLAVHLPAGVLSPENLVPVARMVGLAAKGARAGVRAATARSAVEAAGAQVIAESILGAEQGLRTREEQVYNVVGAGVVGGVLGGGFATIGKAKRKALQKLIGAETMTDAVDQTNRILADEIAKPDSELGQAIENAATKADEPDMLVQEGGRPMEDATIDLTGKGDLTMDAQDNLRGMFLKAIESRNPQLAKLYAGDKFLMNMVMKIMFFNPTQRLARSKYSAARLINDNLTKTLLTSNGAKGVSLQDRVELNEALLLRKRAMADTIYDDNRKRFKEAGITEAQFHDMAGKAARRGGVDSDPAFDALQGKDDLIALVNQRAEASREIESILGQTADRVGAFATDTKYGDSPAESILAQLDEEGMSRFIDRDRTINGEGLGMQALIRAVQDALLGRREQVLPQFKQERAALQSTIDTMTENGSPKETIAALQKQVDELDEEMAKIQGVTDEFLQEATAIASNYLGGIGDQAAAKTPQSPLRKRALRVDIRYLEDFLINDVREIEARYARSVLPDLSVADFYEQATGGTMMASLRQRLEVLTNLASKISEYGVTRDDATKFLTEWQNLSDAADAADILAALRLAYSDTAYGELGRLQDAQQVVLNAIEQRKNMRGKINDLMDAQEDSLDELNKAKVEVDRLKSQAKKAEREIEKLKHKFSRTDEQWVKQQLRAEDAQRKSEGKPPMTRKTAERKAGALRKMAPRKFEENEELLMLQDQLDAIKPELAEARKVRDGAKEVHDQNVANTKGQMEVYDALALPVNELAERLKAGVGSTEGSLVKGKALGLQKNLFRTKGAWAVEDATIQFGALARAANQRINAARNFQFQINTTTEHLLAGVRREHDARDRAGEFKRPGMYGRMMKLRDRDMKDIQVVHDRIRNVRGTGGDDMVSMTSKRLRDYNYVTKMGSVVISSLPDLAMALGTAGFNAYARAALRFARIQLLGDDKVKRSYAMELMQSMERYGIHKRHQKVWAADEDFYGKSTSRLGVAADRITDNFGKLTGIELWNSMNKQIAAQAIESRVSRILLSKEISAQDAALLDWFGIAEEQYAMYRKMLQQNHSKDGGLYLSNAQDWADANAKVNWHAVMINAVNKTILTPGAGDLPKWVDSHPLLKTIFQFRTFSMSATNKFFLPGVQRVLGAGDWKPAAAFTAASAIGIATNIFYEILNGNDPREQELGVLIRDGIDRSGALGILGEAGSTALKLANGMGFEGLGANPARYRSRNEVDALLGPTLGSARDLLSNLFFWTYDGFNPGDASRMRRMLPYQNLWLTRMVLDGGANLGSNGVRGYFDDYLKIEHRLAGFDPADVR